AAGASVEEASAAEASAAFSPPQAAKAKDNKAAANRDFFILVTFKINLNY
ncbi:cell wall protein TIR3, partial [Neisseria gonorrhoeae]